MINNKEMYFGTINMAKKLAKMMVIQSDKNIKSTLN
jgi:hypothetical protein